MTLLGSEHTSLSNKKKSRETHKREPSPNNGFQWTKPGSLAAQRGRWSQSQAEISFPSHSFRSKTRPGESHVPTSATAPALRDWKAACRDEAMTAAHMRLLDHPLFHPTHQRMQSDFFTLLARDGTEAPALWTNVPIISASPPEWRHACNPKEGMADAHDAARCGSSMGESDNVLTDGHLMASRTGRLSAVMTLEPVEQGR
ncbi:hypothetical protein N431DRAFT_462672 [Stipitochalara longipes BDJ]|nr:hypothetical protein N431DRAFT_462672 [Stipitochalara longipes BDJ]